MTSRTFIGGNWKSNCTKEQAVKLATELVTELAKIDNDSKAQKTQVVVSPPFIFLDEVNKIIQAAKFKTYEMTVSAQNCSSTSFGAFTGEIATEMVKSIDVNWVVLGHSERRHIFKETNEMVSSKIAKCMQTGLNVIACIGETLDERRGGKLKEVLVEQMVAIKKAEKVSWANVVIAYEPVWAIGTGEVATPEQAQEVHQFIRKWMAENVSEQVANTIRIIYGGSVKPNNASDLFAEKDIDGFLVGGASLKPADFAAIIKATIS